MAISKAGAQKDVQLSAESTALVIVDMENEFCKPIGKVYIGPEVKPVIEKNAALLKYCRDKGVPVIFVRSVRYLDDPDFVRFHKEPYLIEGTNGPVIIEELTPMPDEPVVEKHTHDCFHNTTMERLLKDMVIGCETHTIIVTGVMSNVCVYHAMLGFHVRHYFTVLPIDCTVGYPGIEDFVISQFTSRAYGYNVTLTTSGRISITAP